MLDENIKTEKNSPIKIVTDSSACISSLQAKRDDIHIAPMSYVVASRIYNETYIDKNGDFLRIICENSDKASTSHPSISSFMSIFSEQLRKGGKVLCIVISSRLSGSYTSAQAAANTLGGKDITVVDSRSAAGGLYMIAQEASRLAKTGLNLNEIAEKIEDYRAKIGVVFSVDDISPLRRSGRAPLVRHISSILNLHPVMKCEDGAVVPCSVARGSKEQVRAIIKEIPKASKEIIIHYIDENSNYVNLYKAVRTAFPEASISFNRLDPVLCIHLGCNVIGAAWRV